MVCMADNTLTYPRVISRYHLSLPLEVISGYPLCGQGIIYTLEPRTLERRLVSAQLSQYFVNAHTYIYIYIGFTPQKQNPFEHPVKFNMLLFYSV